MGMYGVGMGTALTCLTVLTALFKRAAVTRVRRASRYLEPLSAILLLLASAYIMYFWLTLGGLLNTMTG